ncbi:MAG: hypothetical protein WC028_13800 [Candidatus Obscuribacterales bacterium]
MSLGNKPIISSGFVTVLSFNDWDVVERFFELWKDCSPESFPVRYGVIEPFRRKLDITRLPEIKSCWKGLVFFENGGIPRFDSSISIPDAFRLSDRLDSGCTFQGELVKNGEDSGVEFISKVAVANYAKFGYVHVPNNHEYLSGKAIGSYTRSKKDSFLGLSIFPVHLNGGIPNVYWCTYLGHPYVSIIGKEAIDSCGAYEIEWLNDDLVRIQLTKSIMDSIDNEIEFEKFRSEVKDRLGYKVFRKSPIDPRWAD